MKNDYVLNDDDWMHVLSMLPDDLEESCLDKLAIERFREIRCAADLLRLAFAYGVCDMSLRQTATWACAMGLADISNVAVLKRLKTAGDWLGHLVGQWLVSRGLTTAVPPMRVRIVDGSVVTTPGSRAEDFRLHIAFDLADMRLADVDVTPAGQGERLQRHVVQEGEVLLADRGYAKRPQLAGVLRAQGHVVVRIHWKTMPLETREGKPVDIATLLDTLEAHEIGDWPLFMRHDGTRFAMRLVAVKKSRAAAGRAVEQAKRKARQKGKGSYTPDPRSLKAACYTYVLTDLGREEAPADQILELYRLRWQVELAIKRIKSLLNLNLRAKEGKLARTYLLANILGALIIEELTGDALSFFPWGFPLSRPSSQPLAAI